MQEDAKRNGINFFTLKGRVKYYVKLFIGDESAFVFRYLKCLRCLEFHLNNSHKKISHRILYYYYRIHLSRLGSKYHIQLLPNTCGYGLRIMHLSGGGGVLLNAKKIGNYCGFNSGTLIGNKDTQDARPIIGDYVAFGPGAKAIGKIYIGDNVFVAANAVVVTDIPSNSIVGGIPAKVLKVK